MKKIITAVAVTLFACSAAYATGLSDTVMDPQVIAADTTSSATGADGVLAALAAVLIILGGAGAF